MTECELNSAAMDSSGSQAVGRLTDACLRVSPEDARDVPGRLREAGVSRALILSTRAECPNDAGDAVRGALSLLGTRGVGVPSFRPLPRDGDADREFERNQLELLWQLGQLGGVEFHLAEDRWPSESILEWLDRREVITVWNIDDPNQLQRFEVRVLDRHGFPVILCWRPEDAGELRSRARFVADRHRHVHLLTSGGWSDDELSELVTSLPCQVLLGSNGSSKQPGAALAGLCISPERHEMVAEGNLVGLLDRMAARREAAIRSPSSALLFPRLPQTEEEMRSQGFELVAPGSMPDSEPVDAKEEWADKGIQHFYQEHKPWASWLVQLVRDLRPRSVLEFGCNVGRNLKAIAEEFPDLRLLGLDVNKDAVQFGRDAFGLDLRVGDEETLAELGTGEFDLVFTVSVLDHIPRIDRVCERLVSCASRAVWLLEVTLPAEGKVIRHYDHKFNAVRTSTGASYSWDVTRYTTGLPRVRRVDSRPCYLHSASLGPYYHSYIVHLAEPESAETESTARVNRTTSAEGHSAVDDLSPIFIGGTGRSGTTLLVWLLGMSERMACYTFETQYIVSAAGLPRVIREGESALSGFMELMRGRWLRRQGAVHERNLPTLRFLDSVREQLGTSYTRDDEMYSAGMSCDIPQDDYDAALAEFGAAIRASATVAHRQVAARRLVFRLGRELLRLRGRSRWVEKTPKNLVMLDFLVEMFPKAKLVNCIRDGRDVVASIVTNQFWPIEMRPEVGLVWGSEINVRNAAEFWKKTLQFGQQLGRAHREAYHELYYERLIETPRDELERLCGFLNEPMCGAWLDVPYRRETIGKWRSAFDDDDRRAFKEVAGDLLIELGYAGDNDW